MAAMPLAPPTTLAVPGVDPPPVLILHPGPDPLSAAIRAQGVWEPFETSVMLGLLGAGDGFVDVGANLGYYTVLGARRVGPSGWVAAFEPDAENFRLLQSNVAANGLANVTALRAAVAERAGEDALYVAADNRGDHRLYATPEEPRPRQTVPTVTLDASLPPGRAPRLVKIDAQGAELRIFQGMSALLRERGSGLRIVTEVWPYGLRNAGSSHGALLALLSGHGLRAALLDEATQRLAPIAYDELERLLGTPWYAEQRGFVNLLLE
jgi:FkbM family methyltransferase